MNTKLTAAAKSFNRIFVSTFEGEGDPGAGAGDPGAGAGDPGAGAGDPGAGAGDPGAGAGGGGQGVLTQEQVNSIIAGEKKKWEETSKKSNSGTLSQLQVLKTKAKLNDEERATMNDTIEDLRKKVFTSDELAQQEQDRLKGEYDGQLKEATQSATFWQAEFTGASIRRSITDAAVLHEAYNPQQLVALVEPLTRLVEVKDEDGKHVKWQTEVDLPSVNKEGEPVVLKLDPAQAVEQMKKREEYFNLFKGVTVDGLSASNNGSVKGVNTKDMSMEQYAEHRKKEKAAGRL